MESRGVDLDRELGFTHARAGAGPVHAICAFSSARWIAVANAWENIPSLPVWVSDMELDVDHELSWLAFRYRSRPRQTAREKGTALAGKSTRAPKSAILLRISLHS